jgi:hypothetical protein
MCINWSRAKFGWRKSNTGRTQTTSRSHLGTQRHLRTSRVVPQRFSSSRMCGDTSGVGRRDTRSLLCIGRLSTRGGRCNHQCTWIPSRGRRNFRPAASSNTCRIFSRNPSTVFTAINFAEEGRSPLFRYPSQDRVWPARASSFQVLTTGSSDPCLSLPPSSTPAMVSFGDFKPLCEQTPSYPWCNLFYRQVCSSRLKPT